MRGRQSSRRIARRALVHLDPHRRAGAERRTRRPGAELDRPALTRSSARRTSRSAKRDVRRRGGEPGSSRRISVTAPTPRRGRTAACGRTARASARAARPGGGSARSPAAASAGSGRAPAPSARVRQLLAAGPWSVALERAARRSRARSTRTDSSSPGSVNHQRYSWSSEKKGETWSFFSCECREAPAPGTARARREPLAERVACPRQRWSASSPSR